MLEIRRSPSGIEVHVAAIGSFPLPDPPRLKAAAIEKAAACHGKDSDLVGLIQDCEFDYEVAPNRKSIGDVIALVVTTSSANAAVLRDDQHPILSEFWAVMTGACSDIGDHRVIERTDD